MNNPGNTALKLLADYFKSKKLESPVVTARNLIDRISINPQSGSWANPDLIESAYQVIERMNFDVDDLVENYLGVDLSIESLEEMDGRWNSPVFGMARPNSKRIAVCERTLAYEPLYRSTIMHETGHILLHTTRKVRSHAYTPFARNFDNKEMQANEFMRNILLPEEILLLGVALICQMHGMAISESLQSADSERGRWQWQNRHFPFLINHLCVSRQLISYLLLNQRIISQATYDFHKSYGLPNRWLKSENYRPLAKVAARMRQSFETVN